MEITLDLIRTLADQNILQTKLKDEDSFVVSEADKTEVENLLR